MEVGIGLPSTIPGTGRGELLEWARRAEARGFSTLGTLDRIVYPGHDPLIALTAAAAVTERIRLMTAILLAPTRANGAVLAKQAATLDVLSGGRLVLGVAVGRREDDFEAAGVDFDARAQILDEMLERLERIWAGDGDIGPPTPAGRPELILGGLVGPAFRRAARHAAGWTGGNCTPDDLRRGIERLLAAWEAAGREGAPRTLAQPYYALGERGEAGGRALPARLLRPGRLHRLDRRAGGDRRRDRARERPGLRRGGLRRADLLPLRREPGPGRPARGRPRVSEFATYPSLRGQVAFVSGGASGLGAEFVAQLAAQGVRVGFVDIQDDAGEALAEQVGGLYQRCDVRDVAALQAAIATTGERLGPVTVLVNNAANDHRQSVETLSVAEWDEFMEINLRHHFFATQAAVPMMRAAGRGSVVNLGSISAHIDLMDLPVYITAKAGIEGLTRTLARELGPDGIRVNCVLPGWVMTERQLTNWINPEAEASIERNQCLPQKLYPADVARLVLWLAAEDSRSCTAQKWVVDGGWT